MKTTVTYEDVENFINASARWLTKENLSTPLSYAVQKMRAKAERMWRRYLRKADGINLKYCSLDERGNVLKANGEYQFTPEKQERRDVDLDKLYEDSPVEIEPHYIDADRLPKDLPLYIRLAFVNFVLREEDTVEEAVMPVDAAEKEPQPLVS